MLFHLLFSIPYILSSWISFYMGWNIKCHGFGNDGVVRIARCKGNAKFCYVFYGFVNGYFWSLRINKYSSIKVVSIFFTWQSSITCFGSLVETYSILHDKTRLHIFDNFITILKHRRFLSLDRTFNVSRIFATCTNVVALEIFMAFVQTPITFGLSWF
jgi:hypothetical protein